MKIRVIQYDDNYSYEIEIHIGGHWFSFDLTKEEFESLKEKINTPEQHKFYGN